MAYRKPTDSQQNATLGQPSASPEAFAESVFKIRHMLPRFPRLVLLLSVVVSNVWHIQRSAHSLTFNVKASTSTTSPSNEGELIAFLDSVGQLNPKPLIEKCAYYSDSFFTNQRTYNKIISQDDYTALQKACRQKSITLPFAKQLFGADEFSAEEKSPSLFIRKISLNHLRGDLEEYVVVSHTMQHGFSFFRGKRLLAGHTIWDRGGPDFHYYKGPEGKTYVYYIQNYSSGTGVWWNNFNFYRIDRDGLRPVLNELEGVRLMNFGPRVYRLDATVLKTNPLSIKMIYSQWLGGQGLGSTLPSDIPIVDDSTIIHYEWDSKKKKYVGQYSRGKISQPQILSYYLEDNDLLFINAHYKELKNSLSNPALKPSTLRFLKSVRDAMRNPHRGG